MNLFSRFAEMVPKKKTKEELDEHYNSIELEKGDFLAMCIAAFITFLPVVIIAMAIFYGIIWLIMTR